MKIYIIINLSMSENSRNKGNSKNTGKADENTHLYKNIFSVWMNTKLES